MKGVVFSGKKSDGVTDFPSVAFPSISFGSGTIQKEDLYRYAKRNARGEMRRIGYVGYTIRIECKWALLTREQYETVMDYITQEKFKVTIFWQGQERELEFYAGNSSATPFKLKLDSGSVSDSDYGYARYYRDVSFPIISSEVLRV